jgi:regulatory protein
LLVFLYSEDERVGDVITALRADPIDPDKVHLFVNDKHIMSVSLDVAAGEMLSVGQQCPPERVERLHAAQELNGIYERALNFLSYRPRSAREVEMRMRQKGYSPDQIANVMERLVRAGYVDDKAFAQFWVTNRMAFSPRGPRLLKSELRQKGVAADIVDAMMAEHQEAQAELAEEAQLANQSQEDELFGDEVAAQVDEPVPGSDLANALALARKRSRSYSNLDPQVARRRLSAFLMRRGYDYSTIDGVMRRLWSEDEEEGIE